MKPEITPEGHYYFDFTSVNREKDCPNWWLNLCWSFDSIPDWAGLSAELAKFDARMVSDDSVSNRMSGVIFHSEAGLISLALTYSGEV